MQNTDQNSAHQIEKLCEKFTLFLALISENTKNKVFNLLATTHPSPPLPFTKQNS